MGKVVISIEVSNNKDLLKAEEKLIVPREDGTIMHGELAIGKAVILFAEATEVYTPFPCGIFILISDVEQVYNAAIANGAISMQEPAERDYGKSAGFQDSYGNCWWMTTQG